MADVRIIMPNGKPYVPSDTQRAFHKSPALFKYFVGGMGSGKSVAAVINGILLSMRYPKNFGIVVREDIPSLKKSIMRTYDELLPKALVQDFNKSERTYTLINGSQITFDSSDNPEKVRSMELGWFHLEEANKIPREYFDEVLRRVRSPHIPHEAYCGMLTSNPVSKNHWLYKQFTSGDLKFALFQNSTRENVKNLPPNYIEMLQSTMSDEVARRFIEGEFSFDPVGTPVYSPDFQMQYHVGRFMYNEHRPIIRGWDFGYHRPACVYMQHDDDGRVFVLAEQLGKDIPLVDFVGQVLAKTNRLFPSANEFQDFCDPAGNQASDKGEGETSIQILTTMLGHPIYNRRSKIMEGVEAVRSLLRSHVGGRFRLNIDASCDVIIEGMLGGYHFDEKHPDAITKDGYYEHLMDALRYAIIGVSGITQDYIREMYRQEYQPISDVTGY